MGLHGELSPGRVFVRWQHLRHGSLIWELGLVGVLQDSGAARAEWMASREGEVAPGLGATSEGSCRQAPTCIPV